MIKFPNGLKDTVSFGKYRSKNWEWVIMNDPDYVSWLFDNNSHFDLDHEAKEVWRNRMLAKEAGQPDQPTEEPRLADMPDFQDPDDEDFEIDEEDKVGK